MRLPSPVRTGPTLPDTRARPRQDPTKSAALHAAYQAERAATEKDRAVAYAAFVKADAQAITRLQREHFDAKQKVKTSPVLRGSRKRDAYETLADIRKLDWAAHAKARAASRAEVIAKHPLPTWQGWLEDRATAGDTEALGVLRSRQAAQAKASADVLRTSDPAAARDVILADLKPQVRKNGHVVYQGSLQEGELSVRYL